MKQNISAGTAAGIVVVVLAVLGLVAWQMFGPKKAAPPKEGEVTSPMQGRDSSAANRQSQEAMQKAMERGGAGGRPGMPRSGPGGGMQGTSAPTSMPGGPPR